jgi:putative membrane protein
MPLRTSQYFFSSLLLLFFLVFLWSAIAPNDRLTWLLEVLPTIIALPILWVSYQKFPLTHLVYLLIFLHAIILLIGGHYTYAEVPFFSWLRDAFDLSRNYYDRLGHFAQGFVPAMIAREILLRKQVVKRSAWLFFIVCCICLSISAFYELIEWWVAIATGIAAEAFLGTQGDVWDTQWDMFIALIGAMCAQIFLSRYHNQQLSELDTTV